MIPVLIIPGGYYQLLQSQKPFPRAVVLATGRWQIWTGGSELWLPLPGPPRCTELGHSVCWLCGSSPCRLQPTCASPSPCLSQPPEVLALVCAHLCPEPDRTPASPSHTCPDVHSSPALHECELLSHLPSSSVETQLGPGARAQCTNGWLPLGLLGRKINGAHADARRPHLLSVMELCFLTPLPS